MPRCTRKGCQKEFEPDSTEKCVFHAGAPVFHEGLKSWSCCSDVYKPVLDFDEFMKIPGCTKTEKHTDEAPKVEPSKLSGTANAAPSQNKAPAPVKSEKKEDGTEVFTNNSLASSSKAAFPPKPAPTPVPEVEEEDDPSIKVEQGTKCRRKGCKTVFSSDEENRIGDGEATICVYHPKDPIFHEGSKGYLCCKRRVLEFDEFLKIEGCKTGRHVFAPKKSADAPAEELVQCRIDHYQTLDKVHVSVFAKKADKEKSTVKIEEMQVELDILLPDSKRFKKTIDLFGPVDAGASSVTFFGTKVELNLQKQDRRSWSVLERTENAGNFSLTFGVSGRTGTIGAKEVVLDDNNKLRS